MADRAFGEEIAGGDQFLDDGAIGVAILAVWGEDFLACEQRDFVRIRTICRDHIEGIWAVREGFAIGEIQMVVVFAMTGRGVNEARAGIGRDMIAGKQRHVEIVALPAQRMRADHAFRIGVANARDGDLRITGGRFGQCVPK